MIRRLGSADNPAIITSDDAQSYCYPQAFATAKVVHDRLMNGPIRELQESVKGLGEKFDDLDEKVDGLCEMSRKVDDIHGWFQDLNERVFTLETDRD